MTGREGGQLELELGEASDLLQAVGRVDSLLGLPCLLLPDIPVLKDRDWRRRERPLEAAESLHEKGLQS
jgi:hypothetical protein